MQTSVDYSTHTRSYTTFCPWVWTLSGPGGLNEGRCGKMARCNCWSIIAEKVIQRLLHSRSSETKRFVSSLELRIKITGHSIGTLFDGLLNQGHLYHREGLNFKRPSVDHCFFDSKTLPCVVAIHSTSKDLKNASEAKKVSKWNA